MYKRIIMIYPGSPIKSLIIEYLAEKRFAQAKEIISAVQKIDPKKVSFQSIYKQLDNLVKEGILEKHYKVYTFSYGYVSQMNRFKSQLTRDIGCLHDMKELMHTIEKRSKQVIHFDAMAEMAEFYKELMGALVYKQRDEDVVWYKYMVHFASYYLPTRSDLEKKIGHVQTYNKVYGAAPIDLQVQKKAQGTFWEFESTRDNSLLSRYQELNTHGDYAITIEYDPKRFHDYMDLVSDMEVSDRGILDFSEKYRLFSIPITFTIEKNSDKARAIEKSILSLDA